jgi:hypothetical protein
MHNSSKAWFTGALLVKPNSSRLWHDRSSHLRNPFGDLNNPGFMIEFIVQTIGAFNVDSVGNQ